MSAGTGSPGARINNDLGLLAPCFRDAVRDALAECNNPANGLEAMVYETYRSQELQAVYYARGRTVVPPTRTVTNAATNLYSWHGYGLAVDIVHRTLYWKPPGGEGWFRKVAEIFKRYGCKWGGDWTHPDTPHMQWGLCRPSPSDEARRLLATEGVEAVWRSLAASAGDAASKTVAVNAAPPSPLRPPPPAPPPPVAHAAPAPAPAPAMLAWGGRVSDRFRHRVVDICTDLDAEPSHLMACMAFESGETFSPAVRNQAGSGAIGLIQFMPATAHALGTSVEQLATMSAEQQLDVVQRYFAPYRHRLQNLGDVYMAILWPAGVGRPDSHVLFDRDDVAHPLRYRQNAGLDVDRNGIVTREEACAKIRAKLAKGMQPDNSWPL